MAFTLPPLPYSRDALQPHISTETLDYHYGKHHQTYVNNLNKLVAGSDDEHLTLEAIIHKADGGLFNNAAQMWNHAFYWHCLSPAGGGAPTGIFAKRIATEFGSFEQFKEQFNNTAITVFGSGWVWLIEEDGKLKITSTSNADTPIKHNHTVLIACDVWEHAYYIDYRNARPLYIQAFWNLIDWDFVASHL